MKKGDLGTIDLGGLPSYDQQGRKRGALYRHPGGSLRDVIGTVNHGDVVMFLETGWPQTFPPIMRVLHGEQVGWVTGWIQELKEEKS